MISRLMAYLREKWNGPKVQEKVQEPAVRQRPFFIDQAIVEDQRIHVPGSGTFYGLLRPACNRSSWAEENNAAESWDEATCEDCLKLKPEGPLTDKWGPWDKKTVWLQGPIPLGK